jgi:hypothetical protein
MKTSKLHFGQIPVETVKKIAQDLPQDNAVQSDGSSVETQDEGTPTQEPWRQLARQVQHEPDPTRMMGLVKQLIATFDEERLRKSPTP